MGYTYDLPSMSGLGYRQIGLYLRGRGGAPQGARDPQVRDAPICPTAVQLVSTRRRENPLADERSGRGGTGLAPGPALPPDQVMAPERRRQPGLETGGGVGNDHLSFYKMHGIGNDFVLIDCLDREGGDAVSLERHDWPSLARRMCDRHFGVGADGVLLVTAPDRRERRRGRLPDDHVQPRRQRGRDVRERHPLLRPLRLRAVRPRRARPCASRPARVSSR